MYSILYPAPSRTPCHPGLFSSTACASAAAHRHPITHCLLGKMKLVKKLGRIVLWGHSASMVHWNAQHLRESPWQCWCPVPRLNAVNIPILAPKHHWALKPATVRRTKDEGWISSIEPIELCLARKGGTRYTKVSSFTDFFDGKTSWNK